MYLVCERGCNKMKLMNQIDGFALNRLGLVWGFGFGVGVYIACEL
jgi:hypothetical protein